jgi:hypothetical protein
MAWDRFIDVEASLRLRPYLGLLQLYGRERRSARRCSTCPPRYFRLALSNTS